MNFVPYDKLSKKKKRALDRARGGWGALSPVTRREENPKAYKRKKIRLSDAGEADRFRRARPALSLSTLFSPPACRGRRPRRPASRAKTKAAQRRARVQGRRLPPLRRSLFGGRGLPPPHRDREDQRRGEVPSFVVSRMGSRGREIEIPSPGVLSLFVHFLFARAKRKWTLTNRVNTIRAGRRGVGPYKAGAINALGCQPPDPPEKTKGAKQKRAVPMAVRYGKASGHDKTKSFKWDSSL
ncbi:MAG: hypothetical protein IKD61_02965 [Oscillospiraceae bacterium]|nr:hypothetical protein [Oscillospiraceae bacterium]